MLANSKTNKEQSKALAELLVVMEKHGEECGNAISTYLKKTYPKAAVIPMYRSAVAIESEGYDSVIIHACGDPHCMGEDITDETLKAWTRDWIIKGQRFGPEIIHFVGEYIEKQISL